MTSVLAQYILGSPMWKGRLILSAANVAGMAIFLLNNSAKDLAISEKDLANRLFLKEPGRFFQKLEERS